MATRHPPFPSTPKDKGDMRFIWAYCALKEDASASRLMALYDKAQATNTHRNTGTSHALWEGYYLVNEQARNDFREAQRKGELLFAWHGTKATEVNL